MSEPTAISIATDAVMSRSMGFGHATSGGRGVRKYECQMSKRDKERWEIERKKEALKSVADSKKNSQKISEIKRAMEAGELDYM
jgi:hypothetical protein